MWIIIFMPGLIKSTVKSKPNARVSLPDNMRTKKWKTFYSCFHFLFVLSLSHLAQLCPAGFLLRIWASIDGSMPSCLLTIVKLCVSELRLFLVFCFSALWGQWMESLESMHEKRKNMWLQKRDWNTGPRDNTASISKG